MDSFLSPQDKSQTSSENGGIFHISEAAAKRIGELAAGEEAKGNKVMFRISVSGGGCSGFQYGFSLDSEMTHDDLLFHKDGATVVIDEMSLQFLAGAELDYTVDLMGAMFSVKNPNAKSGCGCGNSFSVL